MTASSRIFGIVIGETKTDVFVPLAGHFIILNFNMNIVIRYVKS